LINNLQEPRVYPGEDSQIKNFIPGRTPISKEWGCSLEILKRTFNSYQFHQNNCLYIHVPLSTLQGTMKAAAVDILRLKNLRGTTTTFLILKRYDIPPTSFYMGLPLP